MKEIMRTIKRIIECYDPKKVERTGTSLNIDGLKIMVNNTKCSDSEKEYMNACFDRFQNILERGNAKSMNGSVIFSKYFSEILEIPQRAYDMSHLINEDILIEKKVGYRDIEDGAETELETSWGEKVKIKATGVMRYIRGVIPNYNSKAVNLYGYVYKYKISKISETGEKEEVEIFSEIRMEDLQSQEGIDIIVNELLSDANLQLSNTFGYVGRLEKTKKDQSIEVGCDNIESSKKDGRYVYGINETYNLVYDAREATAVELLSRVQGLKNSKTNVKNSAESSNNGMPKKDDDGER